MVRFVPEPPEAGQLVGVRQRRYLVEELMPARNDGDTAAVVRLSCVDDDAQGQPLEVLWESEVDPEILTAESWDQLANRGFDETNLFAAYLHTLRWNCVTATDARLFQSPFRAGIRLDAYQLEPLRKALLLPRVNLFIADDVGLGKTIEAGLIARELLMRRKVRDIVIAAPPSMLLQWREEMEERFGLTCEIVDREYVARVRRERGYGVNPWTTHARFLVSQRLLINEDYAGPLRDWLGEFRPGALLILDEAHHAAPSSGARYAIDSKITRAVRELAPRFEHRLFLSATPHNGHSNSFTALLEILDPQRFCRGVEVDPKLRDQILVRRLKEDIRELEGGFPKRTVKQIDIGGLPADAPELRLSKLLDEYRMLREKRLKGEKRRVQTASGLLICGLQQRLLSSFEAFARTLRVHRKTALRQWEQGQTEENRVAPVELASIGSDDDRALLAEEELFAEQEADVEAATAAASGKVHDAASDALFAKEQGILAEMIEIVEAARGLPDAKTTKLIDWIKSNLCAELGKRGASWNDTRVIIFTEWDDTKRYLRERLSEAIAGTDRSDERIVVFHGPTSLAEREDIKRAFNADPSKHPLRILIATDAAREGLNLQSQCWNLFHFDVPWNPSRMEQRNGRIDRKLQPKDEVFCHYFVYAQRPEDRVLQVLVEKTERIRRELGSAAQVVEDRLEQTLRAGIRHSDVDSIAREIADADIDTERKNTAEAELEQARARKGDLRKEIENLRDRLNASSEWIGFDEEHFRSALTSSLGLVGASPLVAEGNGAGPQRYGFPALDRLPGADPTWADTLDALRSPRPRDQKLWQWRKESPVRPVTFRAPDTMDDEAVHLHLEHRVVRRLLGRFTSQGFVHHDLSRACLTQIKDAVPRVVLLGRLALYGRGGTRLHEEIVPVAARWIDPADRKDALKPYARTAEDRTVALLEHALLPARTHLSDAVAQRLQAAAARDVQELLSHLDERGKDLSVAARADLAKRADAEADAMRATLEAQRKRLVATAKKYDDPQMRLDLGLEAEEEKRQLESNRKHWVKRLEQLDGELTSEPQRVRATYEVVAQRIEPVGLVYLWPVTG